MRDTAPAGLGFMRSSARTNAKYLAKALPFIISAGLLYLLFRKIGISEFLPVFSQVSILNILSALLLDIPFVLLKSYKWRRIARTSVPGISFSQSISSFLIGIGASLFTPAQLGELARAAAFRDNRRRMLALAFADKLVDLSALGLLSGISMMFVSRWIGMAIILSWLCAVAALMIWKRSYRDRFIFFALQLAISVLCFALLMLQFYLVSPAGRSFRASVIGLPLVTAAGMFPATVGGLGLREIAASAILPVFGMSEAQAAAASFLLFVVNGLVPGVLGILVYAEKIFAISATLR